MPVFRYFFRPFLTPLNRTKVELKYNWQQNNLCGGDTLNRTKVELKLSRFKNAFFVGTALNRTKVELKLDVLR